MPRFLYAQALVMVNFALSMSNGMRYPAFAAIILSMLFMACSHKERIMTKKEMQAMADSIVATKTADMRNQAAEDFDRRRSIEVKAKADSIVEAWQAKQPPPPTDTTK